jgi:hypothetical protein
MGPVAVNGSFCLCSFVHCAEPSAGVLAASWQIRWSLASAVNVKHGHTATQLFCCAGCSMSGAAVHVGYIAEKMKLYYMGVDCFTCWHAQRHAQRRLLPVPLHLLHEMKLTCAGVIVPCAEHTV